MKISWLKHVKFHKNGAKILLKQQHINFQFHPGVQALWTPFSPSSFLCEELLRSNQPLCNPLWLTGLKAPTVSSLDQTIQSIIQKLVKFTPNGQGCVFQTLSFNLCDGEYMKNICFSTAPEKGKSKGTGKLSIDHLFPKALDGFVFILSREGDIVYVSESVAKYLGIQQVNCHCGLQYL